MSYQFQPSSTIIGDGDSITAAFIYGGDTTHAWYEFVLPTLNTSYFKVGVAFVNSTGTVVNHSGIVASQAHDGTQDFRPKLKNVGVSGTNMASRAASIGATLAAFPSTDVWLQCGVNDVSANYGSGLGYLVAFRANCDAYWAAVNAANPATRKVAVGIFCWGEMYPDTARSVYIDATNAQIKASVEAAGGTYMDMRTPQQAWEQANNTPAPGVDSGLLTLDGTHPLDGPGPQNIGIQIMSAAFLANTVLNGQPT